MPPDPMDIAVAVSMTVASVGSVAILWVLVRGLVRRWVEPGREQGPPPRELEDLRHAVAQLGAEVGDLQERLDFTERVLAQRDAPPVPSGRDQED